MKKLFEKKEKFEVGKVYQVCPRESLFKEANSDIDLFLIEHGQFSAVFDGKMFVCVLIYRDAKGSPVMRAEKMSKWEFKKYFELPEERKCKCVGELQ